MTNEETVVTTVTNLEQQLADELAREHPEVAFVSHLREMITLVQS